MFANNQVSILVIVQSDYARFLSLILGRKLVQIVRIYNRIALHLVVIFFVLEMVHWGTASDVIVGLKSSRDQWYLILTLDFDLFRICLRDFTGYLIRLQKVLLGDSIDGIQRACLEMWIGAVGKNTDVLFELLDFGLIHSYLSFLRLSILNNLLQVFVKNFILVSLCFDITL